MKMQRNGQSTLEYVIILSAIVAAVIVGKTMVSKAVDNSLNQSVSAMDQATNKLVSITD